MTQCFCDGSQRGLEKSLLDNEAHRFELRKALSAAERQLREEEAALDGLKEENMELQGEAREDPEVHPLLARPAKRIKVSGEIFGGDEGGAPTAVVPPQPASEELQELKRAISQQLTALEVPTSKGLPSLEALGKVRDALCGRLVPR